MAKEMDSCVEAAAGPLVPEPAFAERGTSRKEDIEMTVARVGKEAPDFEASAYVVGEGFENVKLSDQGGRIDTVYGAYDEAAAVNIRGRFLIDPDGIVQAMEVLTPTAGRNVTELIRQVKAYQHVLATGEATPSGWQPGKPTLKPGPDSAGNVWKVWKPEKAF